MQVFPCPIERPHGRRLKRHRVPQLLEEEEEDEGQEEEEQEKKKKVEWKDREETQACLEEGENDQPETYVVLSSPETQEELVVCIVHYVFVCILCAMQWDQKDLDYF